MAWLAGIVDGEGYVAFRKSPIVQVETTSPDLAYVPASLFGGSVRIYVRNKSNVFRWSVYGRKALHVLSHLIPYLQYKKNQAQIVMYSGRYPTKSAMRQAQRKRLTALRKLRHHGTA